MNLSMGSKLVDRMNKKFPDWYKVDGWTWEQLIFLLGGTDEQK